MRPDPFESLRGEVHVGPDVTDAVMRRLGYRAVPKRMARVGRILSIATCLGVIAASMVGSAWVIDLGWRSRTRPDQRGAEDRLVEPERWGALEESLRPLRAIVDEIEVPIGGGEAPPPGPPVWIVARAPLGEA